MAGRRSPGDRPGIITHMSSVVHSIRKEQGGFRRATHAWRARFGEWTVDAIDRRIRNVLRKDGRAPVSDTARAVGLSAAPCARRMERMERAGVIRGYTAVIEDGRAGMFRRSSRSACSARPTATRSRASPRASRRSRRATASPAPPTPCSGFGSGT
ncbi:Lrp/AsnC family transcriptional regulator [Streptomyces filamentosus]|uniref:Lrp/AsnC family transcriptional regulator n=1 Tax=Streptomyces filamentosus TaxID=67294 RepID=UPI0033D128F5